MKEFSVKRTFRGAEYYIHIDNSSGSQKGLKSLIVNGKSVEGNIIPYDENIKKYDVTAVL